MDKPNGKHEIKRPRFSPFSDGLKNLLSKYSILLILLLAAVIRLIGVDYGLPYLYVPDEHHFADAAFRILTTGDLNPHWFGHPGSFVSYLLVVLWSGLIGVYVFFSTLFGKPTTFSDIQQMITNIPYSDPTMFYLSGRILMVVFSIITVYALYILGKKHLNRTIGLLSAFLLAISPLHIDFSRRIRTDISSAMLITLSILFLMNFIDNNRERKWLVLSSLFAGFSIASKYTSVFVVCPILLYCSMCDIKTYKSLKNQAPPIKKNKKDIRGFLRSIFPPYLLDFIRIRTNLSRAMLLIFVGFFVFAPFVILDLPSALQDISREINKNYFYAMGHPGLDNYNWYITEMLNTQLSRSVYIYVVLLGLLWVTFRKHRELKLWILFLFPVLYFILTGLASLRWDRWMIPVLPFTSLLFSIGLYSLYKWITHIRLFERIKLVWIFVFVIFLGVISYPTIVSDFEEADKLTRTDRRTLAKEWIEENLPEGSTIVYEANGPQLQIRPKKTFDLINLSWKRIVSRPFGYYERRGVDYFVISSFYKRNILRRAEKYPLEASRYGELEKKAWRIQVFDQADHPGNTCELYEMK